MSSNLPRSWRACSAPPANGSCCFPKWLNWSRSRSRLPTPMREASRRRSARSGSRDSKSACTFTPGGTTPGASGTDGFWTTRSTPLHLAAGEDREPGRQGAALSSRPRGRSRLHALVVSRGPPAPAAGGDGGRRPRLAGHSGGFVGLQGRFLAGACAGLSAGHEEPAGVAVRCGPERGEPRRANAGGACPHRDGADVEDAHGQAPELGATLRSGLEERAAESSTGCGTSGSAGP